MLSGYCLFFEVLWWALCRVVVVLSLSSTCPPFSPPHPFPLSLFLSYQPSWSMYIQVMTFEQAEKWEFNPFDLTKVCMAVCAWRCCVRGGVVCVAVLCAWRCCVRGGVVYMAVLCAWRCCVRGGVVYRAVLCTWRCCVWLAKCLKCACGASTCLCDCKHSGPSALAYIHTFTCPTDKPLWLLRKRRNCLLGCQQFVSFTEPSLSLFFCPSCVLGLASEGLPVDSSWQNGPGPQPEELLPRSRADCLLPCPHATRD